MRPETESQVASYLRDEQRMNADDRVPLDTAASVQSEEELAAAKDPIYYRNTAYDCRKTRLKIESLCTPMDFGELVVSGRVTQKVPVIPDKFFITYQSLTGAEEYWLSENAPKDKDDSIPPIVWLGYHRVTFMVRAINGSDLPSHLVDGKIDPAAVQKKMERILSIGDKLLDRMMANMHWFNYRVDKLIDEDIETLKNG